LISPLNNAYGDLNTAVECNKRNWLEGVESHVKQSMLKCNYNHAMSMMLLGHSARLSCTLSTSIVRSLPGNGGIRTSKNRLLDGSGDLEKDLHSLLPKVNDIVEAQYHGRKSRRNWGYRGVQITAVNVIGEEIEGYPNYTYDLRYPDGDQVSFNDSFDLSFSFQSIYLTAPSFYIYCGLLHMYYRNMA
jgi:hypothetical protein